MIQSEIYQSMLCEVNKLILRYFTFSVTTATAEKSFSSLHRMKTCLHNTVSPCRQNLFILYTHKQRADALDLKAVAKEFASVNSRRINYFRKY